MSEVNKLHFRFQSNSSCAAKNPNCPVVKMVDFWAKPDGSDSYRVYKNIGTAYEVFGEAWFAACQICLSHHKIVRIMESAKVIRK